MRHPLLNSTVILFTVLSLGISALPVQSTPTPSIDASFSSTDPNTIAQAVLKAAIAQEKLDRTAKVTQIERVGQEIWMYNPVPYWKIAIADQRQTLVYFTTQTGQFRVLMARNGQPTHSTGQPAEKVTWSPAIAASSSLSKTCRTELINEVSHRWNHINGILLSDTLPRVTTELETAQRRGDDEITLNTLEFATNYILSGVNFLDRKDHPQLSAILDRIVALARPLPRDYSAVKTGVLTQSGTAYQRIGQSAKAQQTLQLAAQAASGIQGNQIMAQAQTQLAEAWVTANQSTQATTALNIAVEQIMKGKQDAYARRDLLSQMMNLYIQAGQPTRALTTLNLLSPQDYERSIAIPQIAATFVRTKDPFRAKQILDPLLKQVLDVKDIEQREIQLMSLVVHYAPSGDFAKLQQIAAVMKRPNQYRARAWFAIAGEARNFNQTTLRTQALAQLMADLKAANMIDHFGGRFDHEWYGELHSLASQRKYQPELKAIITELRPINLLGIVLQDLIDQKQFETARRMVPKPMPVQIDAAVNDESDFWLDRIAIAQLQAGQPKPIETRITSANQDVRRLLRFAQVFHQAENRPVADQLLKQATAIANSMPEQAAIANALRKAGYSADPMLNQLAASLRQEPIVAKRAELLLTLSQEFSETRDNYVALAERAGLANQVEFITLARKDALSERRMDEAYRFISSPKHSPSDNFDFILQLIELHLSQGNFDRARSLLDLPVQTLLDAPESSKPPKVERSSIFHRTALNLARAGDLNRAIALTQNITPAKERKQLQQRLRCWI
jgi:hypothetical protein